MTVTIALKSFAVWFGILLLAIANGGLREAIWVPEFGQTTGLLLSGISLSICIFFVALCTLPWIGKLPRVNYLVVGVVWLFLTVLFEFSFGLAQGKSWLQLFEAYRFKDGNIWPIVLLVTVTAPYTSAKIRGWA